MAEQSPEGTKQTWYHLSANRWEVLQIDKVHHPVEDRSFEENRPDGLSVSPTVCQCLIAVPDPERVATIYHIYEVLVDGPEPLTEESNVADRESTLEHLVTADVLARHDGSIKVEYRGWIDMGKVNMLAIKANVSARKFHFSAEEERALWSIQGEEWVPAFDSVRQLKETIEALRRRNTNS